MFIQMPDGSIRDDQGKLIYFSTERFVRDVVEGDCCFICGTHPDEAPFNEEHVLPNWILKRYILHGREINLPNDSGYKYGRYKIPCCQACNLRMADQFETPISALVDQGYQAFTDYLLQEGPWRVFVWLSLIFLKTHLKDKDLRRHLDPRQGTSVISDAYAWEELHHIHCVARSFYTGCELDASALGSLLILPAKCADHFEPFDYRDIYDAQALLLRLDDIALFAVLNDSCAAYNVVGTMLQRITGFLSPLQLRDVLAQLVFINLSLKERPTFHTEVMPAEGRCVISAKHSSQVALTDHDPRKLGQIQFECCKDVLAFFQATDDLEAIKQGRWSSLFRADGSFCDDSMEKPKLS
jgi:hypothetical protein